MIQTWIADVRTLYEAERYQACWEALPVFRKEKADRIRFQKDKALSVGAWTLLEMIRREYGISEETVFNLSHSGEFVLCAVDMEGHRDVQVGCDIEGVKKTNLKIAERFFCPSEYQTVLTEKDIERQKQLFCRYWVLKESFMKATREGMAMDMRSFEIKLSNPPVLLRKPERFSAAYYYREYELSGVPYKMAVCSTEDEIDSEIRMEFKL